MPAADRKCRIAHAAAEISDNACGQNDDRERNRKEEDRHERRRSETHHGVVLQRPLSDPDHGFKNDCKHRGLQAEKQRLHDADVSVSRVDPAQDHDANEARQDEKRARNQTALGLVKQPSDIDRELLRLRAGQQHAEIQRMQKPVLADPFLLLDQNPVHDGNLPGRPPEAQRRDLGPDPRLRER